ncbi:MAG: hypothetical protein SFT94_11405 [Pseudanabaenaceae cyanobacterium bins.68]|nr:hypothetical protein [Pseudanabaenaceae cyanobacterium bins.68]
MHTTSLKSPWITFSFVVLFCSACTETKVAQCNRLVNQLNPVQTIQVPNTPQTQIVSADLLDRIIAKAEAEPIADPQILDFSQKIIGHLQSVSALLRRASAAATKQDKVELTKSTQTAQDLIKQEDELVQQLNTYCAE